MIKELNNWYWVYPRSDKLDLSIEITPVAIFYYKKHAKIFAKKYGEYGEIIKGEKK